MDDLATTADSESASGLDISKLIQILLIVFCFAGAALILLNPKDNVGGEIDKEFDFNQVVTELEIKQDDYEYVTVRKYLQQAWMADRRFRKSQPEAVMRYYELPINHRLLRENPDNDPTLAEIAEYATRRLSDLRFDE